MTLDQNREAWLIQAAEAMTPWIREVVDPDFPEVKFRVSVGWPGGRAKKTITVGQCWPTTSAEDGVAQIFISPMRGMADTVNVLGTLLHEMIHAYDDCKDGHTGRFIKIAKPLGFIPKWTSSDNRSPELTERLEDLAADLGLFPSAAITAGRAADTPKTQTNRQIKAECVSGSGYKVRLSQKWIDEVGTPICPCCGESMEVA